MSDTMSPNTAIPQFPITAQAVRPAPMVDRRSDSIAIARVICIFGVVYVHAWTGVDAQALLALHGSGQDLLRWTLMEGLGRGAVPLLGLISGWLVAGSARSRNWAPFVRHKARTILLPMIMWNALAILVVSGAALFLSLRAPVPPSFEWLAQELFILTRNPDINVQMPFLRDLFLCMVLAPLMVRMPTWALALIMLAAAACSVTGYGPPILMRASILMFFALGMIARRTDLDRKVAAMPISGALLPFAIMMPVKLALSLYQDPFWDNQGHPMAMVDLLMRVAAAVAFWRIAWVLAGTALVRPFKRVEPYMFLMFCGHLILIWTLCPMAGRLTGPLGSPAYPVFLLLQPVMALGLSVLFAKALCAVSPGAAGILSGGRIERSTRPAPKVTGRKALIPQAA
jgi:fucose 4-O-acetylase-like acetyltransferase